MHALLEQLPCLSAFLHLRCRSPRRWRSPTSSRHMRPATSTRIWRFKDHGHSIALSKDLQGKSSPISPIRNQTFWILCNATSSEGTDKGTFSRSASATATSSFSSLRWNEIRSFYGMESAQIELRHFCPVLFWAASWSPPGLFWRDLGRVPGDKAAMDVRYYEEWIAENDFCPLLGDGQSRRSFPLVPPWWPGQHWQILVVCLVCPMEDNIQLADKTTTKDGTAPSPSPLFQDLSQPYWGCKRFWWSTRSLPSLPQQANGTAGCEPLICSGPTATNPNRGNMRQ